MRTFVIASLLFGAMYPAFTMAQTIPPTEHNENESIKTSDDLTHLTQRAEYFATIGNTVEAKKIYAKALNTNGTLQEQRDLKSSYARFLCQQNMRQDAALYYRLSALDEKQLNGETQLFASTMYEAGSNYGLVSGQGVNSIECLLNSASAYANLGGKQNMKESFQSLQRCSMIYLREKNFKKALDYATRVMNYYMKNWPQSEEHAMALSVVARIYYDLGQFNTSLTHYQEALHIYEILKMDFEKELTSRMIQLVLKKLGKNGEAEQLTNSININAIPQYEKLLDLEKNNLKFILSFWGKESIQYAQALGEIAETEYELGKYEDGTLHYSQFVPTFRSALLQEFVILNADEREALWSRTKNSLLKLINHIYDLPEKNSHLNSEMCKNGYDIALLSKGILLNSSIEFMRVLEENGDKNAIELHKQIERNTKEILTMQKSATRRSTSHQLLDSIKQKKAENAQLEITLCDRCPELKNYIQYLSFTWHDVQQALGDDDIAIELMAVEGDEDDYIVALVLDKKNDTPQAIPLCKRTTLKTWLLDSTMRVYEQDNGYIDFWGSLIPFFNGKEHIYFSPTAEIHQLAVEYLKIDGIAMFEKYPLYRVSSTKEICRETQKSKKQRLALFGDIEYAYGVDVSNSRRGDNLSKLPYTKDEIKNIYALYKKKAKIDLYTKVSASEKAFRELSGKGVTLLHIASHGVYNATKKATEQEAMRGSILAFCGYNVVGTDPINDGRVSAEDVSQMNLRNCELAVLSACKTALGGQGADGIFGLQRGFKNAGVHSLLMSLKPVYDESTAKLMVAFYQGLASGKSKRQSLLDAQKAIKDQGYKDGKYWAPFILLDGLN